jgi:hypothetical protein
MFIPSPRIITAFAIFGSFCFQAPAALSTIAPENVTASSQITDTNPNFSRIDDFIVNGNGLSGGTHTGSVEGNMWLSSANGFGGLDPDPRVTFDLGGLYLIDQIQVWNYNENPPNLTNRGVNAVTINFGATAALGGTVPGITNFAQANAQETYAGEVFDSFTPFEARYIEFDIDSNHGDGSGFYGLSEVQFSGTLIPEPSSMALAFFGFLAFLRRRR